MNRRTFWFILLDILFVLMGFWISVEFKRSVFNTYLISYSNALIFFGIIWLLISLIFNKYDVSKLKIIDNSKQIIISNLVILAITTVLIYLLREDRYSRFLVFGTVGFTTILELLFSSFWHVLKKTKVLSDDFLQPRSRKKKQKAKEIAYKIEEPIPLDPKREHAIKKAVISELGKTAYCYFEKVANLLSEKTLIISTTTRFNIINQRDDHYNVIINLKRINDVRWINKFIEAANEKLPRGGLFICMAETKDLRKKRILAKYLPIINIIYYTFDYFLKRVFPKFPITKNIYFLLTRGENRVLSRAELLGRLYSCGFEVLDEDYIDNLFFVVSRKVKHPAFDLEPTYGPFVKLKRIGKGGKIIKVYKMRTMHPYAEYLQNYVFEKHNLQEGGKFKNDFRVSTIGRIMRRFWLDELPMLINFFRGDLKLFGVRPLSQHYFNLYTKELQVKRTRVKPGLVPPFYVDNPKTLEEIMASEMKYLDAYEKHPIITDVKYFFRAFYNIVFKKYRSS